MSAKMLILVFKDEMNEIYSYGLSLKHSLINFNILKDFYCDGFAICIFMGFRNQIQN